MVQKSVTLGNMWLNHDNKASMLGWECENAGALVPGYARRHVRAAIKIIIGTIAFMLNILNALESTLSF